MTRGWPPKRLASSWACCCFPIRARQYTLSAPEAATPLPSQQDVEQAAAKNNPELKSALAAVNASNADVQAAWGALLPSVGLNVTYGIDAQQFAVNGPLTPDGIKARNLGYSTSFTVNIPVWDWLASENKVKQSQIRRDAAQVALTNTQRRPSRSSKKPIPRPRPRAIS